MVNTAFAFKQDNKEDDAILVWLTEGSHQACFGLEHQHGGRDITLVKYKADWFCRFKVTTRNFVGRDFMYSHLCLQVVQTQNT